MQGNFFSFIFVRISKTISFCNRFEETNQYGNDCNSNEVCIGGYARIIAVVKELQRSWPNPIYFNAGDTFAGSIWYSIDKWNVTSYFMNLHKADVMVTNVKFHTKKKIF